MSPNYILSCAVLAVLLCLAGSLRYGGAQGTSVPAADHTGGGIPYLSGGVGRDEQEALQAVRGDYNLHVTFAQRDGHYLSDVHVTILDDHGATLLEAVAQGPWLLTNLPPGKYSVSAALRGKAQQRIIQVPAVGQAAVYFYW
jgi:hypothetical protein